MILVSLTFQRSLMEKVERQKLGARGFKEPGAGDAVDKTVAAPQRKAGQCSAFTGHAQNQAA